MFIYICMSTKIILQSHGLEIILLKNKLDKWFPLQGKLIPLTLQVRRATIVAREFIRVVRRATIVALPRRSLFTSISRGLRKQLKVVLQELVAAAFL